MNKRGFTLVEVIGVLTILALIILVAFPNILQGTKKTNKQMEESSDAMIIEAGKEYFYDNLALMDSSEIVYVYIKDLIDGGYLETNEYIDKRVLDNYCVKAERLECQIYGSELIDGNYLCIEWNWRYEISAGIPE